MSNWLHLEESEKIIYIARKHWFVFLCETFFIFIFAILPFFFHLIPENFRMMLLDSVRFEGSGVALFLFFWGVWLFLLWIIFVTFWTDYYLDVWYVTNHRIIDVEQRGLFNRTVSSFRFDQIQDVTVEIPGLLATVIDFGTVKIRTASEETFKFKTAAHPSQLKEKIMAEHHRVHYEGDRN